MLLSTLPADAVRAAATPTAIPATVAAALSAVAPADATTPPTDYVLRAWRESDGLPSDELAGIVQDAFGYLWVATNNELTRFDGTSFESQALPAHGGLGGLARTASSAPPASGAGVVVPGTDASGRAGYFALRAGQWAFEATGAAAAGEPVAVFSAPDGSVWVGCADGTLRQQPPTGPTREHRPFAVSVEAAGSDPGANAGEATAPPPPPLGRRRQDRVPTFATAADGQLWVEYNNRLVRFTAAGTWVEPTFPQPESVVRICSSSHGAIWVLTPEALLRATPAAFTKVLDLPKLLGAHYLRTALEDHHGYLWLGTRSQGLHRVDGTQTLHIATTGEDISGLCEDHQGNLWVTTNGGGLDRLRPRVHQLFDRDSGLIDRFSYTVAEDAIGAAWLANRDGGMARIVDGQVDPISRRTGWRAFSARSVFPAPDGMLWITSGLGIFRVDPHHPETAEREPALINFRNVRSSFITANGDYWFAADNTHVARWRDGTLTQFGPEQGLDETEVRAFAQAPDGRLWLGAANGALFRSTATGFERVHYPSAAESGHLQVIRFEPEGHILIGTTRYGLLIFPHGDTTSPRRLTTAEGLVDNNISQILRDDHDRFWFAARRGIFWVPADHIDGFATGHTRYVHAVALGRDDGLPYLSCLGLYQPAAWKSRDGSLWFATRSGVVHTDPAQRINAANAAVPVTLTALSADAQPLAPGPHQRLSTATRRLQIRVSALELSSPENVRVRYRLDGYDDDWTTLGADRTISYARLPAGHYTLRATASNGTGEWVRQPPLLELDVVAPWWLRPPARLSYALLLFAGFGLAVRTWSHRRLRHRLEQSERDHAVERERARIARNIHDDIGATLTRISLLTQTAQQSCAAPAPALDAIHDAARTLIRSMDEVVWAADPRHDSVESLACFLANYAPPFLAAADIRCRLQISPSLPDRPLTSQARYNLFLAVKEALNNVVKHAHATAVTIAVQHQDGRLTVQLSDNGRGLTPAAQGATADRASAGNGLRNLTARLSEIGGTATVAAASPGGTIVTLALPLATTSRA